MEAAEDAESLISEVGRGLTVTHLTLFHGFQIRPCLSLFFSFPLVELETGVGDEGVNRFLADFFAGCYYAEMLPLRLLLLVSGRLLRMSCRSGCATAAGSCSPMAGGCGTATVIAVAPVGPTVFISCLVVVGCTTRLLV